MVHKETFITNLATVKMLKPETVAVLYAAMATYVTGQLPSDTLEIVNGLSEEELIAQVMDRD
jgi:hypothetical protein